VESSPFPHHGPLEPDQVRGRDALLADLTERITARRVTALLGPRRYGKTSVLRRIAADVEAASTSVVWVDLYELTSMVDLAIRLDDALGAARGPVALAAARTAATVGLDLGLLRVALTKPSRPDTTATVHVLLDTLVRAATTEPTLVVLDEFASIARVDGAAGLVRTKLQHHFQDLGLIFAGSEPSTMRALFAEREQPFYGQADLVQIPGLDAAAVHDVIVDGFRASERDPGRLPALIHVFCGGHPRRTMQTADLAWSISEPGVVWTEAVWEETLQALRAATADSNETLYSSLGRSDQTVLRILASGGSVWGRAAELLGLNPTPARAALGRLRDAGHVITNGSDHHLVDPVLADWLRHRLPI
jgi:uncharacterized protein